MSALGHDTQSNFSNLGSNSRLTEIPKPQELGVNIHYFYKKYRSGPRTESFSAFGDLDYSKFLKSFLTFS